MSPHRESSFWNIQCPHTGKILPEIFNVHTPGKIFSEIFNVFTPGKFAPQSRVENLGLPPKETLAPQAPPGKKTLKMIVVILNHAIFFPRKWIYVCSFFWKDMKPLGNFWENKFSLGGESRDFGSNFVIFNNRGSFEKKLERQGKCAQNVCIEPFDAPLKPWVPYHWLFTGSRISFFKN